jgi:predicted transcriptional regulator
VIAEQGLNGNGSGEIRIRLPLKRKEIARMINISPQYVSELLTELVEEGVLWRKGRELIIVDQSGLWHEIDFEELILNH